MRSGLDGPARLSRRPDNRKQRSQVRSRVAKADYLTAGQRFLNHSARIFSSVGISIGPWYRCSSVFALHAGHCPFVSVCQRQQRESHTRGCRILGVLSKDHGFVLIVDIFRSRISLISCNAVAISCGTSDASTHHLLVGRSTVQRRNTQKRQFQSSRRSTNRSVAGSSGFNSPAPAMICST